MKIVKTAKPDDNQQKNMNIAIGKWGEEIAAKFLEEHGFEVLNKNERTPDGEIDIIAKKGGELVFVEVKTRRNTRFSFPEEAVNDEKLDHLESAAGWYLTRYPEYEDNWRLDVITVIGDPFTNKPRIDWFENVTG